MFNKRYERPGTPVEVIQGTSIEIDSKAMRKITTDLVLVLVGENVGSVGILMGFAVRFLTKAG